MQQNQTKFLSSNMVFCLLALNAIIMEQGLVAHSGWYILLLLTIPLLAASIIIFKRKES